jgi:serine/threonine protein kinase
MAPELIENGEVSAKCDVYAFGIFMWECYTMLTPYKGLKPPQIVLGVVSSQLRPAFASTTPSGYRVRQTSAWLINRPLVFCLHTATSLCRFPAHLAVVTDSAPIAGRMCRRSLPRASWSCQVHTQGRAVCAR